jgi:hypothetical protein
LNLTITDELFNKFNDDGYLIISNFFTDEEIDNLQKAYVRLYALQVAKMLDYRKNIPKSIVDCTTMDDLIKIIEPLEENDKEALYQVQKLISYSPEVKRFMINQKMIDWSSKLLDCPKELILMDSLGLLINRPDTTRLLYKWHSEVHYYPKRENFLNLYFPTFLEKTNENGHMLLAKGSHKISYIPFIEYQGYNTDNVGKKNHFVQYEVPESFVKKFEKIPVNTKVGDVVFFHRNLIHTSTPNKSGKYSFASVGRIWEPRKDLTLSGNFVAKPYGNDYGRPNIDIIQ